MFPKQLAQSAQVAAKALEKDPDDRRAQWVAVFLLEQGADASPQLKKAKTTFDAWRKRVGEEQMVSELRKGGAFKNLSAWWGGWAEEHYEGPELLVYARWLIQLSTTADEVAQRPYAFCNFAAGWDEVGKQAAKACAQLAECALKRDPENNAALMLFADPDFLKRTGRKKAPVPRKSVDREVAKIQDVIRRYAAGESGLSIPSLEPIKVDRPEIVEALIAGLDHKKSHGVGQCIRALGRATVELPRITKILAGVIETGGWSNICDIRIAIQDGNPEIGIALAEPLLKRTEQVIAKMTPKNSEPALISDCLSAFFHVAPQTTGKTRARAKRFLEDLMRSLPEQPKWKRERLHDVEYEGPEVLLKFEPPAELVRTFVALCEKQGPTHDPELHQQLFWYSRVLDDIEYNTKVAPDDLIEALIAGKASKDYRARHECSDLLRRFRSKSRRMSRKK
jgi:hypothetical protein